MVFQSSWSGTQGESTALKQPSQPDMETEAGRPGICWGYSQELDTCLADLQLAPSSGLFPPHSHQHRKLQLATDEDESQGSEECIKRAMAGLRSIEAAPSPSLVYLLCHPTLSVQ